jgi:hypothetical protein
LFVVGRGAVVELIRQALLPRRGMDCDILPLCLSEPNESISEGTWCSQCGHKYMQPYFLKVVHEVGTACLAAEEEGCESDVYNCSGNHVEEYAYAVDAVCVGGRGISGERRVAGIVIDYFERGV